MTTVQETVVTITDEQVAAINAARTALEEIARSCSVEALKSPAWASDKPDAADYGRIHALADVTANDLFVLLNWANAHYVRNLTDAQLHNRTEEAA